jgi:hypothetical protein
VRDQATINFLSAQVPNPFYPLLPETSLSGNTCHHRSCSSRTSSSPMSTSMWARDTRTITRCIRDLRSDFWRAPLVHSYTWSKVMEARTFRTAGDPFPEKVISDQDRPQRIVITAIYELRVGKRKAFGGNWNGFGAGILSGWQVSGIYQGRSGPALGFETRYSPETWATRLVTPLIFLENCATLWESFPAVSFRNTKMEYLAVRCVACRREFPVERIDGNSQAVHFQRSSFRASYTCPHCNATSDYTRDDLMPSAGHSSFVSEVRDGRVRKSPLG